MKGNAIEFGFEGDAGGQKIKVSYKGTVESATAMKGTAVYTDFDDKVGNEMRQSVFLFLRGERFDTFTPNPGSMWPTHGAIGQLITSGRPERFACRVFVCPDHELREHSSLGSVGWQGHA